MHFEDLDRDGLIQTAKSFGALVDRVGKVGGTWIAPDVLRAFQAEGISLSASNFYSVVPEIDALPDNLWAGPAFARAWDQVPADDYGPTLVEALSFLGELQGSARHSEREFHWDNGMFPPLDAAVYYGLIRARRPRRILEVGAGFSTLIALRGLAANRTGTVTCVEPFPSTALQSHEGELERLWRIPVQQAPDDLFSSLEAGDILFIDTSHASKAGSDVHDILFRVFPLLAKGVNVHVHDIFLPFEYPREWLTEIGIIWNEQYALLALLMNSTRYRVILPNHLASIEQAESLAVRFLKLDVNDLTRNMSGARGGSLWLVVNS